MLGGELWPAFVDASQLENALINLAVNARDAMPEGGTLTIETENCGLDAAYAATPDDPLRGNMSASRVADTGSGMSEEVRARRSSRFSRPRKSARGPGWVCRRFTASSSSRAGMSEIYT